MVNVAFLLPPEAVDYLAKKDAGRNDRHVSIGKHLYINVHNFSDYLPWMSNIN